MAWYDTALLAWILFALFSLRSQRREQFFLENRDRELIMKKIGDMEETLWGVRKELSEQTNELRNK